MAKPDAAFICIGTYPSEAAAGADYGLVKGLHAGGTVGSALTTPPWSPRTSQGKVHVNQAADTAGLKAEQPVAKELEVSPQVIDKAVQEAATQVS